MIRTATLSDVDAFRELRLAALKDHPTAFGQSYEENLARPREYWQTRLSQSQAEVAVYFAERDDKLIGMTGIARPTVKKAKHSATVWGVYVAPAWRGLHIAEAMIQACLEWAKIQKLAIVKLAVVADNQSAKHCYERIGFTTYGVEPRAIFYDDKYYDEHLMSRFIEKP